MGFLIKTKDSTIVFIFNELNKILCFYNAYWSFWFEIDCPNLCKSDVCYYNMNWKRVPLRYSIIEHPSKKKVIKRVRLLIRIYVIFSDVEVQRATYNDNTNAGSKYNWRFICTCHLSLRTIRFSVRWYLVIPYTFLSAFLRNMRTKITIGNKIS